MVNTSASSSQCLSEMPRRVCSSLQKKALDQQSGRENLCAGCRAGLRAAHGRADWFALAATQAVFHRVADRTDVARFQNQRFAAEQAERWRIGIAQIAAGQQLALVEAALGSTLFL